MVYKVIKLFFSLFFFIDILSAEIIYEKNNISITKIELEEYKVIYNNNYDIILSDNQSIKNLVLLKKVIKFYEENDPEILKLIDEKITINENDQNILIDLNRNFFRLLVLKNELILQYFKENFSKDDLKYVISNLNELSYPISLDGCLTIKRLEKLNNNDYFINNFYENLFNNNNDYKTKINSNIYNVCIDAKTYSIIENSIIEYIEILSKTDFENFLYNKLEWKISIYLLEI